MALLTVPLLKYACLKHFLFLKNVDKTIFLFGLKALSHLQLTAIVTIKKIWLITYRVIYRNYYVKAQTWKCGK